MEGQISLLASGPWSPGEWGVLIVPLVLAFGKIMVDLSALKERNRITDEKLDVIKTSTDGNLTTANNKIEELNKLIGQLVTNQNISMVPNQQIAHTVLSTDKLVPPITNPVSVPVAELVVEKINAETITAQVITEQSAGIIAEQIAEAVTDLAKDQVDGE